MYPRILQGTGRGPLAIRGAHFGNHWIEGINLNSLATLIFSTASLTIRLVSYLQLILLANI